MSGFVLSEELEPLSFDFRPYVEAHGEIKEPSNERIKQLRIAFAQVFGEALEEEGRFEGMSEAEVRQAQIKEIKNMSKDDGDEAEKRITKAIAIACSNNPTVDMLNKLPYRGRQAFIGYIVGKFLTTGGENEGQKPQSDTEK